MSLRNAASSDQIAMGELEAALRAAGRQMDTEKNLCSAVVSFLADVQHLLTLAQTSSCADLTGRRNIATGDHLVAALKAICADLKPNPPSYSLFMRLSKLTKGNFGAEKVLNTVMTHPDAEAVVSEIERLGWDGSKIYVAWQFADSDLEEFCDAVLRRDADLMLVADDWKLARKPSARLKVRLHLASVRKGSRPAAIGLGMCLTGEAWLDKVRAAVAPEVPREELRSAAAACLRAYAEKYRVNLWDDLGDACEEREERDLWLGRESTEEDEGGLSCATSCEAWSGPSRSRTGGWSAASRAQALPRPRRRRAPSPASSATLACPTC